jgi:hypothetical protein
MNSNPYTEIVDMMRAEGAKKNSPSVLLGEVVSPMPNLIIKLGGMQIDKRNILIADCLLGDYQRQYSIDGDISFSDTNCGTTSTEESHSHDIASLDVETEHTEEGTISFTDSLQSGDQLAILPTDDRQKFIVLCRVVSIP